MVQYFINNNVMLIFTYMLVNINPFFFFFFFLLNKEILLKIKTLENFQTKLEANQVDYTIKPKTLQRGREK